MITPVITIPGEFDSDSVIKPKQLAGNEVEQVAVSAVAAKDETHALRWIDHARLMQDLHFQGLPRSIRHRFDF